MTTRWLKVWVSRSKCTSEAIPVIVSYAHTTTAMQNVTSSLVRFRKKNIFAYFEKALCVVCYNAGVVRSCKIPKS
jgi:UDP-N-acetylmuramyl tripeptide synthase